MVEEKEEYRSLLSVGLVPEFSKTPIRTFIDYDPKTCIMYEVLGPKHLTPSEIQIEKERINKMKKQCEGMY